MVNVSVTIPTRGDVDLQPILDSFPSSWETVVWDNSGKIMVNGKRLWGVTAGDLAVYARYAAIAYCTNDLILTQDDDVVVSDPQAIIDAWYIEQEAIKQRNKRATAWDDLPSSFGHVVCNMPQEFRPHYPDSGLVGFGAAFHRDAPERAFKRWFDGAPLAQQEPPPEFYRRPDNIFTVLTPRVLVDVPKADCAWASDENRMWRQKGHTSERNRMIELARQVRDS